MDFIGTKKPFYLFIFATFFILKNSFALESLSYSGRLVQASGAPVVGPVKIRADLAYTNATGSVLCTDEISSVALSKGVFHVKIDFDCSLSGKTLTQVLSQTPAGHSVAIQITDITDGRPPKSYSFQALHAMPYATVASQLAQMGANDGEFLKWNDTDKKWEAGNVSGASGGTVTNVTATSPLSVTSGSTAPALTISQASSTTSGYLSSADWNTFNSKEGTIAGGTAAQYYRGDKTWQTLDTSTVPENVNLYFTNARVLGLPLTGFSATNSAIIATDTVVQGFSKAQGQINTLNTAAGTFLVKNSSDVITGTVNVGATGFLTITNPPSILTDATNKQYVDTGVNAKVSKSGDTMSGVLTLDNDLKIKGGSSYVTVKGHASSAAYDLVLPSSAGTSGYVLRTDGAGNLSWIDPTSVAAGAGTVGSGSITDNSIVDADINASAGIAQSKIANLTTDLSNKQPLITAGTTSQYYRGDKTFVDLGTDVRGTQLTGYSVGANTALIATDTTLSAFQKVQGQIDATNTVVAGKEPALANPSDTTKYYRGDKSWQTLDGGAVANSAAGNIAATNVQSALNELDSEKQANITSTSTLSSRELRFYELTGNGTNYTSLKSPDDLTATINYVFPSSAPAAGQILSSDASGVMSWISIPSAPVASTFGRTGVVTATAGDYNATQITNTAAGSIAATNVQAALNELDSEKEPLLVNPSDATKYYRGDKTWSTFATDAINSVLSTFSLNAGSKPAVTNSDTVVGAFGKVQKYLNDMNTDYVSKSANNTVTGSFNISGITSFIQVPTPTGSVVNEAANVQYVQNYVGGYGQWDKGASNSINYTAGNVGVGTNNPTNKLQVMGASPTIVSEGQLSLYGSETSGAANTGGGISFQGHDGSNPGRAWGSIQALKENSTVGDVASFMTFSTRTSGQGLAEKVRINSLGRVGIGTSTPLTNLEILSRQSTAEVHPNRAGIITRAEGTDVGGRFEAHVNSSIETPLFMGMRARGTLAAPQAVQANDYLVQMAGFGHDGTNYVGNGLGRMAVVAEQNWVPGSYPTYSIITTTGVGQSLDVERVRVTSAGNVGVGTATPLSYQHGGTNRVIELHNPGTTQHSQNHFIVSTGATAADSAIGSLTAAVPSSTATNKGVGIVGFSTGPNSTAANPTGELRLWTRGTADTNWAERMRITETGNVGIGTPTPTTKLDVNGSVSVNGRAYPWRWKNTSSGVFNFGSTTWVDIVSVSFTLPAAADVEMRFDGSMLAREAAIHCNLRFVVDGSSPSTTVYGEQIVMGTPSNWWHAISRSRWIDGMAAGAHTIKVQGSSQPAATDITNCGIHNDDYSKIRLTIMGYPAM